MSNDKKKYYPTSIQNSINHINDLSKSVDHKINTDTFCIQPFIHLSTTPNGQIKLCCRSHKIADASDTTFKDVWYSDKMNEVRKAMINGEKEKLLECENCWRMESNGIKSSRQGQNISRIKDYHNNVKSWLDYNSKKQNSFPFQIPVLELKPSNLCNFKCRMCWPKDSTPWMTDWESVKDFYPETDRGPVEKDIKRFNMDKNPLINLFEQQEKFIDEFKELAPSLDELELAGGEPLLDPLVFKILNILIDQNNVNTENIILKYSTNLSKLNFNKKLDIIEIWKKFKKIKLSISVDGDPKRNEYIRHGADSKLLKQNLNIVREQLGDKVEVVATTTLQAYNTPYMVETVKWIVEELQCKWQSSRLQWPKHLHSNVLSPKVLKESLKKLEDLDVSFVNDIFKEKIQQLVFNTEIQNVIGWLKRSLEYNKHKMYYEQFEQFNEILDKNRKVSINDHCPLVIDRDPYKLPMKELHDNTT